MSIATLAGHAKSLLLRHTVSSRFLQRLQSDTNAHSSCKRDATEMMKEMPLVESTLSAHCCDPVFERMPQQKMNSPVWMATVSQQR
jgi:hypothetical protein